MHAAQSSCRNKRLPSPPHALTSGRMTATVLSAPVRRTPAVGLVHLALALGGFAIGTTEFATMSLLPLSRATSTSTNRRRAMSSAPMRWASWSARRRSPCWRAKWPRRTMLIALMAVFAVANGLSALAPSYGSMLVFRFLSGLPHGAYFGIASLVAASLVPAERRTPRRGPRDARADRRDYRGRAAGQCAGSVDRLALGLRRGGGAGSWRRRYRWRSSPRATPCSRARTRCANWAR